MVNQKLLITGSAGFIGYHLCKSLLDDGFEIFGVDNINNYYDPKLKLARLDQLNQYKNFTFEKIDIADRNSITKSFKKFGPTKVVNLAAQAGVRYSIKNPYAYMDSNLVGFLNIIELCRNYEVEGLIYASSSSVYGGNKEFPFKVNDRVNKPLALYGATKRANELIAHSYSHLYDLNTTGLRYFTVYGPWGRPDMAMFIFTKKIIESKTIPVFNDGNMTRNFTFIDDIISGTISAIKKNYHYKIFNLANTININLNDMIGYLEEELNATAKKNYLPLQAGDVTNSYADIGESIAKLNFNPETNINTGISKFVKWYKNYYSL